MGVIKDMMIDAINKEQEEIARSKNDNKYTRWCFTMWQQPICNKPELLDLIVWQRERTSDTFTTHYQGYMEFVKPYSRTQVKNLFKDKTTHYEPAEKSKEMNFMYCLKPDSYSGERCMIKGQQEVFYELRPHKTVLTWNQVKDILDVQDDD